MSTDETIRTKALVYTRDHAKEILAYAITVAMSVVTFSVAFGHKQGATEVTNAQVIEKLNAMDTHIQSIDRTLQTHGERMAALEATSSMTQSDVHDLKALADHASDVAESFKVPRLTGHRAKH